jgi:guanine deaminase
MDLSSRPTYVEDDAKGALANFESYLTEFDASFSHLSPEERLQRPVITPRFVPTCSETLLQGLGKLAKDRGVMIQSHLAEARDQVDWVRETRNAEDIDVFDNVRPYYSLVQLFDIFSS